MAITKESLAAVAQEIEDSGEDLTNPVVTTGRPLPAEGSTRLRFIEYIELGNSTTEFTQPGGKKKKTTAPRVRFTFELSGKNHPPMEYDGEKVPHVMGIKVSKGMNAKSGYIKLFKALTGDVSDAKNFVALLGDAFMGTVKHREFDKSDGTKGKAAHFGNATDGFTIKPATYEDPETNELKTLAVDQPLSPLRLFLWDRPTLEMWDSLYIEGEWDNGDSKNEYQETIKRAENFKGSPIYELLIESGRGDEVELAQFNSKIAPKSDPLGEAEPSEEDKAIEAAGKKAAAEAAAKAQDAAKAAPKAAGNTKVAPKAKKPVAAQESVKEDKAEEAAAAEETEEEREAREFREFQAAKRAAANAGKKSAAVDDDPLANV